MKILLNVPCVSLTAVTGQWCWILQVEQIRVGRGDQNKRVHKKKVCVEEATLDCFLRKRDTLFQETDCFTFPL